ASYAWKRTSDGMAHKPAAQAREDVSLLALRARVPIGENALMNDATRKMSRRSEGPAHRLRRLWRDRQPPELRAFLAEAGPLEPLQVLGLLRIDQHERWLTGQRVPLEQY